MIIPKSHFMRKEKKKLALETTNLFRCWHLKKICSCNDSNNTIVQFIQFRTYMHTLFHFLCLLLVRPFFAARFAHTNVYTHKIEPSECKKKKKEHKAAAVVWMENVRSGTWRRQRWTPLLASFLCLSSLRRTYTIGFVHSCRSRTRRDSIHRREATTWTQWVAACGWDTEVIIYFFLNK